MAKFLITGGAGFIGSHLADYLLSDGHQVRVLDNLYSGSKDNLQSQVEFIQGDVTNINDVKNALKDVDGCFHLAAIASVDVCEQNWDLGHTVNTLGTLNIFKVIEQFYDSNIAVIFPSSAAVYGLPSQLPLTEQSTLAPISNYGLGKLYGEQMAKLYAEQYNIRAMCLRLFNIYGTRQQPDSPYSGVISKFIYQVRHDQSIKIYGDGSQTRDFVLVNDLVSILSKSMDYISASAVNFKIANVGTGKQTAIIELANTVNTLSGNEKSDIHYLPEKPGDIKHSFCDDSVLQTIVGNIHFTPLETGLTSLMK